VFSRTSSQDVRSRAKAGAAQARAGAAQAKAAAAQAKAQAALLQGRALQAKEQFTPLAKSAQLTASQGVQQARSWAAPRVEQAGIAVQERIAPKVSTAMIATAHRMQPATARRRRLWPTILAGIVTVAAGAVAAILLRGQRANRSSAEPASEAAPPPVPPASGPGGSNERSDATQVDVNGQVRTP
jgi:hypothetical protein